MQSQSIGSQYFGEGLTLFNNHLYQLTWKENVAFQYDLASLQLIQTFSNPHEGWGLTNNGTHILMSTGSANIYFVDPETFTVVNIIRVLNGGNPVTYLNELEFINGKIWANIWLTKRVAIINPNNGNVDAIVDFSSIRPPSGNEMNGIAYDAEGDRIFVTGKNWPTMYHIELTN